MSAKEVVKLEKTWNVSIRRMFNLPRETHCYLIEELSDQEHVQTLLAKRFLNFINSIRKSKKLALRSLLRVIEYDTLSVTGRNLTQIMLQTDVQDVKMLKPSDVKKKYRILPENEKYRVGFIKEIVDVKNNQLDVEGFDDEELEAILQHLCVS